MNPKLVVLGLDGATYTLLRPWMEAGMLPHLRNIMDTGVNGTLASSIPPITSPAWPCFMTGKNPGKHGVAWFLGKRRDSYEEVPLDSTSIDSKTLWEILSENGKNVAVLNVPTTYPVRPVSGVMISGFLTPPGKRDFAYPSGLLSELEESFGPYKINLETPPFLLVNQSPATIQTLLRECHEMLDYQCRIAEYLMEKDAFDFFMLHILGPDRIQHWLWNLLDSSHPRYNRRLAQDHYDGIVEYYRRMDQYIGRLMEIAGPDATVVIMSDHGFGPVHKSIDLNAWLLKEGYLKIKEDRASQIRLRLWRKGWTPEAVARLGSGLLRLRAIQGLIMRARATKEEGQLRSQLKRLFNPVFLSISDIDWTRTRCYGLTGFGMMRINLRDREPLGIVKPGREYEQVRDEIVEKLNALRDPETGDAVGGQVLTKEAVYHGKHLNELPDMIFLPRECKYIAANPTTFITPKIFTNGFAMPGFHTSDGILMVKGRHVRRGVTIQGATIIDLAPTILYLMGTKIPRDMDGRVLTELCTDQFLGNHSVEYADHGVIDRRATPAMSPEDHEGVLDRLRNLGYIE